MLSVLPSSPLHSLGSPPSSRHSARPPAQGRVANRDNGHLVLIARCIGGAIRGGLALPWSPHSRRRQTGNKSSLGGPDKRSVRWAGLGGRCPRSWSPAGVYGMGGLGRNTVLGVRGGLVRGRTVTLGVRLEGVDLVWSQGGSLANELTYKTEVESQR